MGENEQNRVQSLQESREEVDRDLEDGLAVFELPCHLPGNNRDWLQVPARVTLDTNKRTAVIKMAKQEDADYMFELAKQGILLQLSWDYRMSAAMVDDLNERFKNKET